MSAQSFLSVHEARRLLSLRGPADVDGLTAAFRVAVKAVHPDRPDGDAERFRKTVAAYRLLQTQLPALPLFASKAAPRRFLRRIMPCRL